MRALRRLPRAALALAALAAGCAPSESTVVFLDVSVLPMDRERVLAHQTVLLRGDRIVAVGPVAQVQVPRGARRIDGRGGWVVPGLADMHVHLDRRPALEAFLARGVTTLRNMRGLERHVKLRERVSSGELPGPRIVTSGPHLDSRGPGFAGRRIVRTPEDAGRAVREHRALGFDFVKVYSGLSAPVYSAVVDEARRLGLPVVGHVPLGAGLTAVLESGQRSIEHVEEFTRSHVFLFERAEIQQVARRVREAGVWVCPTLSTYREFGPPSPVFQDFHADLVRGLHEAGVPLLVGTDADSYGGETSPLVAELRALVHAGVAPWHALRAATAGPQAFLGRGEGAGTIAVGAPADLVLVDANPLEDLGALERPRVVCVAGRCSEPHSI